MTPVIAFEKSGSECRELLSRCWVCEELQRTENLPDLKFTVSAFHNSKTISKHTHHSISGLLMTQQSRFTSQESAARGRVNDGADLAVTSLSTNTGSRHEQPALPALPVVLDFLNHSDSGLRCYGDKGSPWKLLVMAAAASPGSHSLEETTG